MEADCGSNGMIYLDYQATTPLAPEARDAMLPWLTAGGSANPHSSHVAGRAAKAVVELAREQVAALLPPDGQVYFTSGATEAANWAIQGIGAGGLVLPDSEHACVLDTALAMRARGHDVTLWPVDADGLVDVDVPIPPRTALVAAMLVNNEIGVIQPVEALAVRSHHAGALFLCDAVQGFGRIEIPTNCDMIAISAHKIHGPKGIGALWMRDGLSLAPLMHGGGQEGGLRSGTLSPALCAGFGVAAALAAARFDKDRAHIERLWQIATSKLRDWTINGSVQARYHGNLNIRRAGVDAARVISELRDVAISAGSACASGSGRPSHVLSALGLSRAEAQSSLRIGFGRYTTEAELNEGIERIMASANRQLDIAA
jgi:cysteine desulfurase